jgi:hypothetical protein
MPLARFNAPFEHQDWIFEPKLDGFRAVAYVEGGACQLVSRNRNAFKTFVKPAQAIGQELVGRSAILDGEIVRPGPDGRPMFYELMPLIHEMWLSVRRCWLAANGSSVDAGRGRQTPWRGGAGRAPNGERSNSLEAAAASFSGLRTPESRIGAAATHADAKYVERFCKALNAFSECSCAFMVSSGRRRNHAIA